MNLIWGHNMKRYEKQTYTKMIDVLVERCCDLCGMKANKNYQDWDAGYYNVNETEVRVEVRQREGTSYPEGGSGTEVVIDLCPVCFKDKLIPWIKSQGGKVEAKEWDW